jgi:dihydroorotate dehydrogenase electron transfer subunit
MMHAVSRIAKAATLPCWVSLETPMACGFGACFSCVTKVRQDDGTWDYRRVCVEGPVFPADSIVFD